MRNFILGFVLLHSLFSFSQELKYSILATPPKLTQGANNVLLEEKTVVDVSSGNVLKRDCHRAITVLNKKGNNAIRAYELYDDGIDVKSIEAWVYDSMGNEIEHFKKKDFKDVSAFDGISIYNDNRRLYLDYTPTTYPYTFVFESRVEDNTTASIIPWFPLSGYYQATKESEYTIIFNPNNKPELEKRNLDGYTVEISETGNSYTFSAKNLEAINYEEYSPSYYEIFPMVNFRLNNFYLKGVPGSGKDWKEFGNWMNKNLLTGTNDLDPATIARVKSLTANAETNLDKARIVYDYLQSKVRYISVQIGIGGWKPMLASDVDNLGYGDCKALSNYTKSLLNAVGVPSYYTIIYGDTEERSINPNFVNLQGNHAILGIPDEDDIVWLECTSQDDPFGYNGNFTDDRDALIITPEGGKIVHTKVYSPEENLQENNGEISIGEDGIVSAKLTRISKGIQYGNRFTNETFTEDELERAYKNAWDYINGFTINSLSFNNDRKNIIFTENIEITAPRYCTKTGDGFMLPINVFNQTAKVPPRISDRKQKFKIYENFKDVDSVTITIPEGYAVEGLFEGQNIENKFGQYAASLEKISETQLQYKRVFLLRKGTFPPEDYNKYRAFMRKASRLDNTKIIITPKQ